MSLSSVLAIGWLVLDLVLVLRSTRGWPLPRRVVVMSQIVVAGLAATVFLADQAIAVTALWALLATVNGLLATLGWTIQRTLALVGFAGTLAALILIAVRSFASLPIMLIAAVFCLASALFPARGASG